jgi:hypothetical protein
MLSIDFGGLLAMLDKYFPGLSEKLSFLKAIQGTQHS